MEKNYELFEKLVEMLGYETLANALYKYFGTCEMRQALESIYKDYDLDYLIENGYETLSELPWWEKE